MLLGLIDRACGYHGCKERVHVAVEHPVNGLRLQVLPVGDGVRHADMVRRLPQPVLILLFSSGDLHVLQRDVFCSFGARLCLTISHVFRSFGIKLRLAVGCILRIHLRCLHVSRCLCLPVFPGHPGCLVRIRILQVVRQVLCHCRGCRRICRIHLNCRSQH